MSACQKVLKKSKLFSQTNTFIKRHVSAKAFIFEKQFDGFPKESDFKLVTKELPALKDGEFLAAAEYLSVDPYMRAYAPRVKTGKTFMGSQVAKIVESKNSKFPEGTYIVGEYGWKTHTISNGKGTVSGLPSAWIIPDIGNLPHSLALGVLGMPGNTAYFGLLELCQPKAGETVIVTGAAGAVGSHVGQIAKIKGCRTVGVAGSDEKATSDRKIGKIVSKQIQISALIWGLLKIARHDQTMIKDVKKHLLSSSGRVLQFLEGPRLKQKSEFVSKLSYRFKIKEFAPYDCYFDNVGGEISSMIMAYMSLYGRISVCGAISGYNDTTVPKATIVQYPLLFNQLRMEGFVVQRWVDRWFEGVEQNKKWINEGKLKYKETVTHGFENMYAAFADMLRGGNTGKAIVKV